MKFKKAALVDVVRREHKEQKITAFLQAHIAAASGETLADNDGAKTFLLLARSPASPVARSIKSLNAALQNAGVVLRVIFSQIGSDSSCDDWTSADGEISFAREIRIINNAALLDAHEQLILGPATSWVGDCMRRDPHKNDAYECYADDCQTTARCASNSFERLWLKSDSFVSCGGAGDNPKQPPEDEINTASASGLTFSDESAEDGGPMAATRH